MLGDNNVFTDLHFTPKSYQYGVAIRVRADGVVLVNKYHLLANDSPSVQVIFKMLVILAEVVKCKSVKIFLFSSIAYSKLDCGIRRSLAIVISLGAMFTALGVGTTVPAEDLPLGSSSFTEIFLLEQAETRLFLNNVFLSSYGVTFIGDGTGAATLEINSTFPSRKRPTIF